ncbi:MAG: hypothetical protein ACJ8E3_03485, partial [Sphingomicrobium sp.]
MRFLVPVIALSMSALAVSTPVSGQRADDQIAPRSVALQKQGETLMSAGKFDQAEDALEASLVV